MEGRSIYCWILGVAVLAVVALSKDATQSKFAVGSDVTIAAIRRVQEKCIFKNDLLFMRRVAYQESRDGIQLA